MLYDRMCLLLPHHDWLRKYLPFMMRAMRYDIYATHRSFMMSVMFLSPMRISGWELGCREVTGGTGRNAGYPGAVTGALEACRPHLCRLFGVSGLQLAQE